MKRPPTHPDVLCVDGNRIAVAARNAAIHLGTTEKSVRMTISDARRLVTLLQDAIGKAIES